MRLVVGLGNPGEKYAKVRHNLGFMVVDEFVKKIEVGAWRLENRFKAEIIQINQPLSSSSYNLIFAKPQTYMNNSGMAVVKLVEYFKVDPSELIVIHDELDLPFGKIKVRLGGAAAGHHGVESITAALGTDKFIRVRLGIGNLKTQSSEHKHAHVDTNKFVLEPFLGGEHPKLKHMLKQAVKALDLLLEKGLPVAQNQFN